MGERRRAREFALQILYSIDLTKPALREALGLFWLSNPEGSAEVRSFTEGLVRGVGEKQKEIDDIISKYSTNWKITRMSAVDRNILRLAIYELRWCSDIPSKATLNEAIELAKEYGTEESSAFVNGVLDKVAKESEK